MGERLVIGTAPRRRLPIKPIALVAGLGLLLALLVTRLVFFELVRVRGGTMAPAVLEGDVLLVASLGAPALGSVVLVEQGEREVLRRVVGLAGDRMATADGVLVRNGAPLETEALGVFGWRAATAGDAPARPHRQALVVERFADGRQHRVLGDHDGAARPWRLDMPEVEVPPGHVFVLCDNRRICPLDEQAGPVALDRINGVARSVVWRGGARVEAPGGDYGALRPLASSAGAPALGGSDPPPSPPPDGGATTDGSTGSASDASMASPRKYSDR